MAGSLDPRQGGPEQDASSLGPPMEIGHSIVKDQQSGPKRYYVPIHIKIGPLSCQLLAYIDPPPVWKAEVVVIGFTSGKECMFTRSYGAIVTDPACNDIAARSFLYKSLAKRLNTFF